MHAKGKHELRFPSLVDRHSLLIRNLLSTFAVRFECGAMIEERIFDQNALVVRLPQYCNGHIVSVFVEGEHLARRLEKQGNGDARAGIDIITINKEGVKKEGVKQCGR